MENSITTSGEYSITRGYHALLGQREKMENAELIWNSVSLPKHRFTMWLATQKRLLTKERLLNMKIQVDDSKCCLCQDTVMETNKHLFVDCEYATKVRDALLSWSKINLPARELNNILELIKKKHWKKFKKEVVAALWGAMVYHIWKARNWKQFKGVSLQYSDMVKEITREIVGRIEMYKDSKRAIRSRSFWQNLCT
ncbi:hypothetical protein MTR67_015520 [Solanum verrucosum]|uniref:Reverse transcriptase zinc-binding domain-containing protein n=1 Tax=Solanum verrucosum TaxID=315347 RepID=A0AAF0TQI8_SOLVR|nr:hypothetical protein MTR67_015520 [Solanum verrucosum]